MRPAPKRKSIVEHVTGGSVFDDSGFSPKKAASLKLKASLHRKIVEQAEGYSQKQLQSLLSETQSRVSQLLRGKVSGFTLDTLVYYAEQLGIHPQIKTTAVRKSPARWSSRKITPTKLAAMMR